MAARPDDLVAYSYYADLYGPCCILRAFHGGPTGEPPVAGMSIEQHLDLLARLRGVDRSDERSFDSGDFPKFVFRDVLESCDDCGGLGGDPETDDYCDYCDGTGIGDRCGSCGGILGG